MRVRLTNSLSSLKRPFRVELLIIVVSLSFFAACAGQKKIVPVISSQSRLPKTLVEKFAANRKFIQMKMLADVVINVRGREKRVSVAMVLKSPDNIYLEFMDPLAGTVAKLVATSNYMQYSDKDGAAYFSGEEAEEKFKQVTSLPWNAKDLFNVLIGSVPVSINTDLLYPVDNEGRFWIAPGKSAVRQNGDAVDYLEVENGRPLLEIKFSNYEKRENLIIPSHISIRLPKKKAVIEIVYSGIDT